MTALRPAALAAAVAALASLFPAAAESQNRDLRPTYGSVHLKAGFQPDPYRVHVTAGVATDAAIHTTLGGIRQWVANAPDFKLYYTAGAYQLTIKAFAQGDTTLLINDPTGRWVADDDSGRGLNPKVTFGNPASGRYDIWVGTYGKKNLSSTLVITER